MNVLERALETEIVETDKAVPDVITGTLIGFTTEDCVPLVTYSGQPGTAALSARTIADLPRSAIGEQVVLMFERGDRRRPIVLGIVRPLEATRAPKPSAVQVEADGERVIVAAGEQLVLRCGRASITLTKAGKVLIDGAYISNRSSGVVRIKGGSIQLN